MGYLIDHQNGDHPLPAVLQDWANASCPFLSEDPRSRDGSDRPFWNQIVFVRDGLPQALLLPYTSKATHTTVVSVHNSKSVLLPVFRIDTGRGVTLTMRYNFYDWKVSVDSVRPVFACFDNLITNAKFSHGNNVSCEGFEADWVFDSYAPGARQFTVEIGNNYQLWAFCHQLALALHFKPDDAVI